MNAAGPMPLISSARRCDTVAHKGDDADARRHTRGEATRYQEPGGPRRPPFLSFAIVVPRARRRLTRDAGDRAQIFVDRTEVMVRHIVIDRPWHYLEKSAVERSGQTIPVGSPSTCWMEVIHVYTCPNDLDKL